MDRPRIAEKFAVKHRKFAWVAGIFIALSGMAFAIANLEPGFPQQPGCAPGDATEAAECTCSASTQLTHCCAGRRKQIRPG